MTLQQAIDHTWEVYQEQALKEAWEILEEKENCQKCAEEHRQLHEWLYKLKRVAQVVNSYNCAVTDSETAMEVINNILEEGGGI